jgi:cell division protein FtsW
MERLLMALFIFFFYRSFRQVLTVTDPFAKVLGCGILFWLASQTMVNLASMTALVPLTGVPLPFISYGGSALIMEMVGLGFLFNIIYRR